MGEGGIKLGLGGVLLPMIYSRDSPRLVSSNADQLVLSACENY